LPYQVQPAAIHSKTPESQSNVSNRSRDWTACRSRNVGQRSAQIEYSNGFHARNREDSRS